MATFNLNQLNELSKGDKGFKKEMILLFLEQIQEFTRKMKKFLFENKLEDLAKAAHTVKSSALVFEMYETGSDLKQIQLLAEKHDVQNLNVLILKVETDLLFVKEELQQLVKIL